MKAFEGQGLRARLYCRKISDSIFWLHCLTPRWLVGAMPCPKKVPKEIYKKEKIEKKIRGENISSILSFIYLGEGTNQSYVMWCSVVPKTPDSKIGIVGSTDTAWKGKNTLLPFSRGKSFFSFLRMRHLLFR